MAYNKLCSSFLSCFTVVGPVDNGTLRLVRSNLPTEGGVQIFNGSQWVEVCDDGWDTTEASVVCRQLGFGSSGAIRRLQGSGSNEAITPPSYSCSGDESMLLDCSLRRIQPSDCDRFENVEVECRAPVPGMSNAYLIIIIISLLRTYVTNVTVRNRTFVILC